MSVRRFVCFDRVLLSLILSAHQTIHLTIEIEWMQTGGTNPIDAVGRILPQANIMLLLRACSIQNGGGNGQTPQRRPFLLLLQLLLLVLSFWWQAAPAG